MMGKNLALLVGLFVVKVLGGTLFSPCANSSQCGENQECDQQRKECRCQLSFHVWHSNCIPGLSFGAPCKEEISCRLANKRFRCSTTPRNDNPTCNCKEHTKYVGDQCIDAPGSGVFAEQVKHKEYTKNPKENEDPQESDHFGALVQQMAGPIGMSFLILIIVGVCIVFHNAKTAQENELPTFTNEAYTHEAIYDVPDMEEEEYRTNRYSRNDPPVPPTESKYNNSAFQTDGYNDSDSSTEEYSITKNTAAMEDDDKIVGPPMVSIQIGDTDNQQNVEEKEDSIEKHEVEVSEKVFDQRKDAQEIIDSTTQEVDFSETTLLKTEIESNQHREEIESVTNANNGYDPFFNNLSDAQNEDCNPIDVNMSFGEDQLVSVDKTEPDSEKDSSSFCLNFLEANSTGSSEGGNSKDDTRKQKYLVENEEVFEAAQVEYNSVSTEGEFLNIVDPGLDNKNIDGDNTESDINLYKSNAAFDL